MTPARLVVVGVGPLGRLVLEAARGQADLAPVGAMDVDPKVGGTEVAGVRVVGSIEELPEADVAIHTATSRRAAATRTIRALLDRGLPVATSCEELHEPDPELDRLAASKGLQVVATGVNPGLVMDRLPELLLSACVRADSVRIRRVVNLSERREPLRRKMGVGLGEAQVRARSDLGHVGLRESMATLLGALGRNADRLDHSLEPILQDGRCEGQDERLVASAGGCPIVTLHLRMAIDEPSVDEIEIAGDPPLRCRFEGGIQGDRATVGMLLSTARRIARR